jgi:hypothetical protein
MARASARALLGFGGMPAARACLFALVILLPVACVIVEADDDGGVGSGGDGIAIVAASVEFGECSGYCRTEIAIDGAQIVATLTAREELDPLENRGRLTAAGRDQLDDLALELAGRELQSRYGCPDCADGGAASIELRVGDDVSAHQYMHDRPPEVLAEVHAVVDGIVGALWTCQSSALVQVSSSCTPR